MPTGNGARTSKCSGSMNKSWQIKTTTTTTTQRTFPMTTKTLTLSTILEDNYDLEDDCVAWFVEHYNDNPEDLCNYQTSDFVNLDMCYTKDLINFYNSNEESVLSWCDQLCDAYGYTSRLQLLEGQTVEDPDDFATGLVNAAMTYLGCELYRLVEDA